MSKAFTKENDSGDDAGGDEITLAPLPPGGKNYITPKGYKVLRDELLALIDDERPRVVEAVHWAASNGDRSENGDYIYGKKRLREIDRRIRFLTQRLEIAEISNPSVHHGSEQVFLAPPSLMLTRQDCCAVSLYWALMRPTRCTDKSAGSRQSRVRCSNLAVVTR